MAEGHAAVRVPGDDGVRHDIQELRRDMNTRFDNLDRRFDEMVEREEAAHAAIGKRIDGLDQRLGAVEDRRQPSKPSWIWCSNA